MLEKIRLISPLIPIILFIIFCIRKASKELWVFFVYLLISLIFDIFLATSVWASDNRFLIWNCYDVFEIIILSYFFCLIIPTRLVRLIINLLAIFYIIFALFYSKSNSSEYHSTLGVVGSIIILLITLVFLMYLMKPSLEPVNIFTPEFLITIGLLINVAGTLFLKIIANKLSVNEMEKYWSISNYSNISMNVIFSAAFLLFYYQHKLKPPENHSVDFTSPKDR